MRDELTPHLGIASSPWLAPQAPSYWRWRDILPIPDPLPIPHLGSWPVMVLLVLCLFSGLVTELIFVLISILISFSLFKSFYSSLCSSLFRQLSSSPVPSIPTGISGAILQSSQIVQWWFTLWLSLSLQLSSPFLGLSVILHWRLAISAYRNHFQLH